MDRAKGRRGGNGPFPIPRVNKCTCAAPKRPTDRRRRGAAWHVTLVEYRTRAADVSIQLRARFSTGREGIGIGSRGLFALALSFHPIQPQHSRLSLHPPPPILAHPVRVAVPPWPPCSIATGFMPPRDF